MRDIYRLDKFYNELAKFHKKVPDWRFGQLMLNFMSWYYNKYRTDVFYVEEDRMLKLFNEYFKEMRC